MSILQELSTAQGDKTEESNHKVAHKCLDNSDLFYEVMEGLLQDKYKDVQADCAEVMTKVAEQKPDMVVPYADKLFPLLSSTGTKVRWEVMHTLALITPHIIELVAKNLNVIKGAAISDESTIVRDWSTQLIVNYAKTNSEAADKVFPILKMILETWKNKQAKRVFEGFEAVITYNHEKVQEVIELILPYKDNTRPVVKDAYASLTNVIKKYK